MSLFKKKDEDRKEAYKPSDDNVSAKEGSAGGKGGGEPAAPSVDPSTKSGQSAIKKSMDDGRLGYGYIDRNTGVEVPWYIDMINGGGANAAGDTFVSPFAELPFGGGIASMPSNLGNAMNIAPYGYNQPRRYAQAGMQGYPTTAAPLPQTPQPSAPTLSSTSAPSGNMAVNASNPAGFSFGMPMQSTMTYRPADVPNQLGYPSGQPTNLQYNTSATMQGLMGTMPEMLAGTEIADQYKNYLMTGGTSKFNEFTQGMY